MRSAGSVLTQTTVDQIALISGKPSYDSQLIVNHVRRQVLQSESECLNFIQFVLSRDKMELGQVLLPVDRARRLLESLALLQQKLDAISASLNEYSELRYDDPDGLQVAIFNDGRLDRSIRAGIAISFGENQSARFFVSRLQSLKDSVETFLNQCN